MFSSYQPPVISSIYIEGLEVSAKGARDEAVDAKDDAQAARDLALQYRNEAEFYYTQVQQIQTGDYVTTLSLNARFDAFRFSDLKEIPSSFTPSAHGHNWNEITGKPLTFDPSAHGHSWNEITGKPAEFEPAEHVHTWQQIAAKPATFPPEAHFHTWENIENKPSVFNPSAHNHSWLDITGKPSTFPPSNHIHRWEDIDGKPLEFEPVSHTHHWDTIQAKPAQATRWPSWEEVTSKPDVILRSEKTEDATDTRNGRVVIIHGASGWQGLGAESGPIRSDANAIAKSGLYIGGGGAAVNFPGNTKFSPMLSMRRQGAQPIESQLLIGAKVGGGIEAFIRETTNAGEAWDEAELHHTGNLNNKKIQGGPVGGQVLKGEALETGLIRFTRPINLTARPNSLSLDGTFNVTNRLGGVIYNDPALNLRVPRSSASELVIDVNGLAGLVVGETYWLTVRSGKGDIYMNT